MKFKLNDIRINKETTPAWATAIKRWSQLDAASFVMAEAVMKSMEFLKTPFDQLVLVSNQGSSHTDFIFTSDVKISPSHFVHTLPNVRSMIFSQLTNWEGPMFCLSQGEKTLVEFLRQAPITHKDKRTMIVSLNRAGENYHCDFYIVGPEDGFIDHRSCKDDFDFRASLRKLEA